MTPPRRLQIWLQLVWPWYLMYWPPKFIVSCPCAVDHLCRFVAKAALSFSEYRVHILVMDKRTAKHTTLARHRRWPVWPGEAITVCKRLKIRTACYAKHVNCWHNNSINQTELRKDNTVQSDNMFMSNFVHLYCSFTSVLLLSSTVLSI